MDNKDKAGVYISYTEIWCSTNREIITPQMDIYSEHQSPNQIHAYMFLIWRYMNVMESQYDHNWIHSSHNHSHKMIPQ